MSDSGSSLGASRQQIADRAAFGHAASLTFDNARSRLNRGNVALIEDGRMRIADIVCGSAESWYQSLEECVTNVQEFSQGDAAREVLESRAVRGDAKPDPGRSRGLAQELEFQLERLAEAIDYTADRARVDRAFSQMRKTLRDETTSFPTPALQFLAVHAVATFELAMNRILTPEAETSTLPAMIRSSGLSYAAGSLVAERGNESQPLDHIDLTGAVNAVLGSDFLLLVSAEESVRRSEQLACRKMLTPFLNYFTQLGSKAPVGGVVRRDVDPSVGPLGRSRGPDAATKGEDSWKFGFLSALAARIEQSPSGLEYAAVITTALHESLAATRNGSANRSAKGSTRGSLQEDFIPVMHIGQCLVTVTDDSGVSERRFDVSKYLRHVFESTELFRELTQNLDVARNMQAEALLDECLDVSQEFAETLSETSLPPESALREQLRDPARERMVFGASGITFLDVDNATGYVEALRQGEKQRASGERSRAGVGARRTQRGRTVTPSDVAALLERLQGGVVSRGGQAGPGTRSYLRGEVEPLSRQLRAEVPPDVAAKLMGDRGAGRGDRSADGLGGPELGA